MKGNKVSAVLPSVAVTHTVYASGHVASQLQVTMCSKIVYDMYNININLK